MTIVDFNKQQAFTAITFFQFPKRNRFWALKQMRHGNQKLKQINGISFSKLMGSGRGAGFSILPDFNTYAMLTVFRSSDAFAELIESQIWQNYKEKSNTSFTVLLNPLNVNGTWNHQQPFEPHHEPSTALRAVITRASIKKSKLIQFWRQVPATSKAIDQAKRRIFSIGVGELPLIEQATFSMWEDTNAIRAFAYQNHAHKKAVRDTHKINWYSEEMFARFSPVAAVGTFNGKELLKQYGIPSFEDEHDLMNQLGILY